MKFGPAAREKNFFKKDFLKDDWLSSYNQYLLSPYKV